MKRDIMKIPTLTSGPRVTWTAENATKSTTTARFSEATLTVKKMAAILYASDELIEDSTEIDVVNFIVQLFSEAIGNEEDRVITRGNGTTEPTGYRGNAAFNSTTATDSSKFDNIIRLEHLLASKYRKNAKFYAHNLTVSKMRQVKDNNGRYLWAEPFSAELPATFHGYPVIEDDNLGDGEIYFGDLKKAYWLGDRKKMTVKVSQDTTQAFTGDQTAIRVVSRIAGNVVLGNPVVYLTGF